VLFCVGWKSAEKEKKEGEGEGEGEGLMKSPESLERGFLSPEIHSAYESLPPPPVCVCVCVFFCPITFVPALPNLFNFSNINDKTHYTSYQSRLCGIRFARLDRCLENRLLAGI